MESPIRHTGQDIGKSGDRGLVIAVQSGPLVHSLELLLKGGDPIRRGGRYNERYQFLDCHLPWTYFSGEPSLSSIVILSDFFLYH